MTTQPPNIVDEPTAERGGGRYHHGNLRAALLQAAEDELVEKGIEHFSLRGVAKRAGVSHAAPAHHFTDTDGLLTALARTGFRRLHAAQLEAMEEAEDKPGAQLAALGLGYVRFALANPALFRLVFSSDRPDYENEELRRTAEQSYNLLVDRVEQAIGERARTTEEASRNIAAVWAAAHGLADLLVAGRLKNMVGLPEAEREAAILDIVARAASIRR